ncbi:hypothetical protein ElyMa_006559300 [Elysia marginata]|uniref:Uncharacterized protein n=1 Tax=Elysia marginata TaxID=1093978 RepID=A0AAV4IBS4_9GAST|nr:hypothetical protein ElyMa_006559300 [Elysia marginata]
MLSWAFRSKSVLSTNRPTRYPGLSGLRAYCLPLDRYATRGLPVQEPSVYHWTRRLLWGFRSNSLLSTANQNNTLGLSVIESTVYLETNTLPWVFRSKSLL